MDSYLLIIVIIMHMLLFFLYFWYKNSYVTLIHNIIDYFFIALITCLWIVITKRKSRRFLFQFSLSLLCFSGLLSFVTQMKILNSCSCKLSYNKLLWLIKRYKEGSLRMETVFASFSSRKYVVTSLFRVGSLSDYILKIDLLSLDCYL
jgi:hypothetical protein